jgi:crotonobetainyl-CoA:carnitine CoA-transferase CaiB-like acyl-CoA transferase
MKKEEFYQEALWESKGPLEGIRVLEATTAGAGPWAGTLLADLGAEVIKIDQPGTGDMARRIPPFVESSSEMDSSAIHLSINRNKKNITLALNQPQGQDLFKKIVRQIDITVENFKPGTMEKWGLGYKDIKKIKPDIIYTSVSGFGQYGPYSYRPGYDPVGQAMGGLMSVTGHPDGPPMRSGIAVADNMTGWLGAYGSVAALFHRTQTGEGQHVDVSLLDSILYASQSGIMAAANADFLFSRHGNASSNTAPANTYQCKDNKYVFLCIALESHWGRLCKLIGREDLIGNPETNSIANRLKNREMIDNIIQEWMSQKKSHEVLELLDGAGIVSGPVYNYRQILEDPHIKERDMVTEVDHPSAGKLRLYGVGAKFSRTPARVRHPAPLMGQNNQEVYMGWLGFSQRQLDRLKAEGAI